MKRLIAGLTVLIVAALGALPASAQTQDPNHWGFFTPKALEGAFQAGGGKLAFLALAAPRNCIDGSKTGATQTDCPFPLRVYFYDQTCTRVNSVAAPLTQNGVALLAVQSLTTATTGNFLAVSSYKNSPQIRTDEGDFRNPVIGTLFQVDLNRGVAWVEPLSQLSGDNGMGWSPYRPVAVAPFLPADVTGVQVTFRFRCPTGVGLLIPPEGGVPEELTSSLDKFKGLEGTLGGDMIEALSQTLGNDPGVGYFPEPDNSEAVGPENLCGGCRDAGDEGTGPSNFANTLTFHFYDTNENPIGHVTNVPCSCFSEARLATIFPTAATKATYMEIEGFAPQRNLGGGSNVGVFAGSWQLQVTASGLNVLASRRFHNALLKALLGADNNP